MCCGAAVWALRTLGSPFHPTRLDACASGFGKLSVTDGAAAAENELFSGVVRSKGHVWIANAKDFKIDWETAGRKWALLPKEPFLVGNVPCPMLDAPRTASGQVVAMLIVGGVGRPTWHTGTLRARLVVIHVKCW